MDKISIESTTPVYTLSTVSALSGISVHSIRQYIDKSLIIPFTKKTGRHLFSQVDVLRLKYIFKLLNEDRLNIAGIRSLFALIPCWAVRNCSSSEREKCEAFVSDKFPCWGAAEKGPECKNSDCRECDVYRIVENYPDVKSFLKTLFFPGDILSGAKMIPNVEKPVPLTIAGRNRLTAKIRS